MTVQRAAVSSRPRVTFRAPGSGGFPTQNHLIRRHHGGTPRQSGGDDETIRRFSVERQQDGSLQQGGSRHSQSTIQRDLHPSGAQPIQPPVLSRLPQVNPASGRPHRRLPKEMAHTATEPSSHTEHSFHADRIRSRLAGPRAGSSRSSQRRERGSRRGSLQGRPGHVDRCNNVSMDRNASMKCEGGWCAEAENRDGDRPPAPSGRGSRP